MGTLALAAAGAFVAGYLGSMVGLVLGTLRLPLFLVLASSPAAGAGTNIAISAAAAGSGGLRHLREGRVDWRVVAWMAPPSVAGAVLGGLTGHAIPGRLLAAGIAALLAWQAADLALRPVRPAPRARPRVAVAAVSGFGIGVVGGAAGVILGTLRMPALLRGVGLDIRSAAGTNLVVGCLLGIAGFAAHAARLEVDAGLLAAGLAGGMPGAWLGARTTGRLPEETLRRLLAAALAVIAVAFAVQAAGGT